MHVVVTGAAGFIGAAFCRQLLDEGHSVAGIDCLLPDLYPAATKRDRLTSLVGHPSFTAHHLDLRTASAAAVVAGSDVVVNLAAMPGLTPSWHKFGTYLDCNVRATQQLLDDLVREPGAHLVHGSSSSVYGAEAAGDEDQPPAPVSPYGVTKLAAEHLVSSYRTELGVATTVLRYFSVYGPAQRPDMAYAGFCRALIERRVLTVTGDGHQTRSNTFIDDVVSATLRACEVRADGAVLNVCGPDEISVLEAIGVLADELAVPAVVEHVAARAGDQRRTRGSSQRARELLGWMPATAVRDGLRRQARHAAGSLTSGDLGQVRFPA